VTAGPDAAGDEAKAADHPFISRPHHTLLALSLPILLALIAEPLTGLADTAFVARLGSGPLAALGVGTVTLSSIFWVFNFLGIGTATEVARALGARERQIAQEVAGLAMALGAGLGLLLLVAGGLTAGPVAEVMGASGSVLDAAVTYLRIRLVGMPALLIMSGAFGALRGMQEMTIPFRIAVSINILNIAGDAILIHGAGPVPAFGIAGAAWATSASHWIGALWALGAVRGHLGLPKALHARDMRLFATVGRDLLVRTGLLTSFLLLTTRAATSIGAEAGAAHQAVRQVWLFTALVLDAFAATAQSLVGYFRGAAMIAEARRVAFVACAWSLGTGAALGAVMMASGDLVAAALVPPEARALFGPAWMAAALMQPLNALSFATDGIHWGTSDYRYLRNVMFLATGAGATAILLLDIPAAGALTLIWVITAGWIAIRAVLGVARIWPGLGASPLRADM
jgi:MATE family multidrug resistance protein